MNYQNFDEMLIVQEIQILNLKSIKKKIVFNKYYNLIMIIKIKIRYNTRNAPFDLTKVRKHS